MEALDAAYRKLWVEKRNNSHYSSIVSMAGIDSNMTTSVYTGSLLLITFGTRSISKGRRLETRTIRICLKMASPGVEYNSVLHANK